MGVSGRSEVILWVPRKDQERCPLLALGSTSSTEAIFHEGSRFSENSKHLEVTARLQACVLGTQSSDFSAALSDLS